MAGMNPGFAAYLAKKKAGGSSNAGPLSSAAARRLEMMKKKKKKGKTDKLTPGDTTDTTGKPFTVTGKAGN